MALFTRARVLALGGCLGLVVGILTATAASATVTGGCNVTATAGSGSTDLTSTDVWHLKSDDIVNGSATYPTQTHVGIVAYVLGLPIPVYSSSGKDTHGTAGPFKVSDYSKYTRVFAAGGSSDSCQGSVLIIVDDQNPVGNLAGLVGALLAVLGLAGVIALTLTGHGGCARGILGAILGLLAGLGAAVVATEAAVLDPRSIVGLIVVIVGLLLGGVLPMLHRPPAP